MSEQPAGESAEEQTVEAYFGADRAKAFIDAVVAIALTLLILPLLDAITSLAEPGDGPGEGFGPWFENNWVLLQSFLISFAVIAMFWINHHRMFAGVRRVTGGLLWISMAWLLTIVWLPVATAMTSILNGEDPLVEAAYIGTMALTSVIALCQELFLRAHPALHDIPEVALVRGAAVSIAMAVLFILSLVVAVTVPFVGYAALFLLFATAPLARLISWMLGVRHRDGRVEMR